MMNLIKIELRFRWMMKNASGYDDDYYNEMEREE